MNNLLSANPSFIRGMGRVLDLGSTRDVYNTSDSPDEADFNAILSDWNTVGDDMENAFRKIRKEIEETTCC